MALQIRENILQQRYVCVCICVSVCVFVLLALDNNFCSLPCSPDSFALLAGYIVQGEFGDVEVNDPTYLEEVPFLESVVSQVNNTHKLRLNTYPLQPNEICSQVMELHKRNK